MKVDFDALYRDHYTRVLGLCRHLLGDSAQAEDAAQEVFVRAYRGMHQYDPHQPFAAWVLSIARNHCIDLIRRRGRGPRLFADPEPELSYLEDESAGPLDTLIRSASGSEIRAAIAALPDRYRLPIVLAYYQDASYQEIADELNVTSNHVGVLLLRGKQLLRHALDETHEESLQ